MNILENFRHWVIVGGQWGDEAKGKITDLLAPFFDYVVRYAGGSNAGHTTHVPEGKIVGHLIPSGLAQGKTCVVGRGVFFDFDAFLKEFSDVEKILGKNLPSIWIDEACTVRTPWHSYLETWFEKTRGSRWGNTTQKAISPMASIRAARLDIKIADLLGDKHSLMVKLGILQEVFKPIFETMRQSGVIVNIASPDEVGSYLIGQAEQIRKKVRDTRRLLLAASKQGQRILFEGAQAALLDANWGTWPYTSSPSSTAGGVFAETGLPPGPLGVGMVVKILPTRVGAGPMPTEIWDRVEAEQFSKQRPELFEQGPSRDNFLSQYLANINAQTATEAEISQYFQVLGDERGSTTGRGRSVGYIDIPAIQYAAEINGPQFLALTKLDMLSGLNSIKVAVAYRYQGQILEAGALPPANHLHEVRSIYEEWPCWQEDIRDCRNFVDLPPKAQNLVVKFEELIKVPIRLISVKPTREAVIVR
ncbi:MAG: adenylosuccinate synthetase [Candidatus Doudnabacteria bacterium]|nr:adenylosuccinate synthetase [Candidatus Doudnabacteria bacterium]